MELRVIERVASKLAPGQPPLFMEAHVIKALERVDAGLVGRTKLSKTLGLGGGTTRTLVKHLRNEGLIEILRSGMVLTKFGKKVLSNIKSKIPKEIEVPESPVTVGPFNIAILVRNAAHKLKYGIEQRDAAIKVGALGATTLVFTDNKLIMSRVDDETLQRIEPIHDALISELKPRENDVIIIGSANNKLTAELGAKAAALDLFKR